MKPSEELPEDEIPSALPLDDDETPVVPVALSAPVAVATGSHRVVSAPVPTIPPPSFVAPVPDGVAAVPAPDAAVSVFAEPDGHAEQAIIPVAADLPEAKKDSKSKEKAAALLLAIAVHVALALLLTLFVVITPGPPSSEITAIAAPSSQEQAPTTKKISEPPPQQQVTQATASMKFTTAINASSVPMPAVEFDPQATTLDLGTTMGDFSTNFGGGGGSIMMFGKKIDNVKKIAVVMDVSRSMTRYLPVVVDELKKIGRDSTLVLYFGCWLSEIQDDEKLIPTTDPEFDVFWQNWQGKEDMGMISQLGKKLEFDKSKGIPLQEVYDKVAKRKDTYFIHRFGGVKTTVKSALMAKEIKDADVVYWLADFQDRVDDLAAEEVVKKYRSRNIKLYMHAPHDRGPSLTKVKTTMVEPLKGEAIVLDIQ